MPGCLSNQFRSSQSRLDAAFLTCQSEISRSGWLPKQPIGTWLPPLRNVITSPPSPSADPRRSPEATDLAPCLRPKQQPPLHLPLAAPEVVTRPRGRGGPESPPSNRYAGDWSVCGRDFLPCGRDFLSGPDYDHVTGSDSEDEEAGEPAGAADFEDDFEAPFNAHLNLKDFDALILDLERELSKQINVCL